MFELKGIYAPIATPFTDGEIDYEKLAANLDRWCASGMEGLVLLGSNGEFVSLTESEKKEFIKFTRDYVNSKQCNNAKAPAQDASSAKANARKRLIVGTGGNSIKETHALNQYACECGADAVLVVTPFYYKGALNEAALERYFTEVADKSPLPVVLYNMPGNTGVNTSSNLLIKLSHHPNIVGVKDTSGNITQIAETIKGCDPSFSVFAGNWSFFYPSLLLGAKGATLALANVCPDECVKLIDFAKAGKLDEAREHAFKLMPLNAAVTTKYGIGGLKYAMDKIGMYGGEPRLPLRLPNEEARAVIDEALRIAGLL